MATKIWRLEVDYLLCIDNHLTSVRLPPTNLEWNGNYKNIETGETWPDFGSLKMILILQKYAIFYHEYFDNFGRAGSTGDGNKCRSYWHNTSFSFHSTAGIKQELNNLIAIPFGMCNFGYTQSNYIVYSLIIE